MPKKGKRTALRWLLIIAIGGIVLISAVVAVLRVRFNGPELADTIEMVLNGDIRGRVEIESVEWPVDSLYTVMTGGWIPVEIKGLEVYDDGGMQGGEVADEERELLMRIDRVTAEIDAHSLIFGHHDFVIRNLTLPDGGYVLLRQVEEPYPLHLYDDTIVSLATAFYSRLSLGFRAGLSATSARIFDIRNFDIRDVTIEMIYPGVHLIVEHADTTGFVHSDFSDPLRPKVYFALAPTADQGLACIGEIEADRALEKPWVSIEAARAANALCPTEVVLPGDTSETERAVYEIPLVDIRIPKLNQLAKGWPRDPTAHDVYFAVSARTPDGTRLNIEGGLLDYWLGYYGGDYDIDMTVENGGPLMELLTDELAGGDDVRLQARVTGPAIGPKVELDIASVDIRLFDEALEKPLNLHLEKAHAGFDMVTEKGTLDDTVARGADGSVRLDASFGVDPFQFNLRADIQDPIDLRGYVPPDILSALGSGTRAGRGRLAGSLEISGDGLKQKLAPLDLWFGGTHITGELYAEDSSILYARNLSVRLGETRLVTNGRVAVEEGDLDLEIALKSDDLNQRLRAFGLPALASKASGRATVKGTLEQPRADVKLDLEGVALVNRLSADIGYRGDRVALRSLRSSGLGGMLDASGVVRLGPRAKVEDFKLVAQRLDLSRIPGLNGMVSGRLNAKASANGYVDHIDAAASGDFEGLTIAGDPYRFTKPIEFRARPDGSMHLAFAVEREGGGSLTTDVTVGADGQLAGDVIMGTLPLQQLGILGGVEESPVGGLISTNLSLSGSLDAPQVEGHFKALRSWVDRSFLGDSIFQLEPVGDDAIRVSGTLIQGDIDIDATIQTKAPYRSQLVLDLRRVEFDRFAPELAEEYGLRGWITGRIELTTPLVPVPGQDPEARAYISEISLWVDNEDPLGRPTPVQIRNRLDTPIELSYVGDRFAFKNPVTLVGPGGAEFQLDGSVDGEELAFSMAGDIDLALLQPYLRGYVDSIEGRLEVALSVGGTFDEPTIDARIDICDRNIRELGICIDPKRKGGHILIRPLVQDTVIYIRKGGQLTMNNHQVTVAALSMLVEDPYTGQESNLEVKGGISLKDFKPHALSILAYGEISGKLLMIAAPETFSRAGGEAHIELTLGGTVEDPQPDIDIYFQQENALTFVPRGLRREIRLTTGLLSLSVDELQIAGLGGSYDGEGTIRDVRGVIGLDNWTPTYVDLTAFADSLSYRIPGNLDLVVDINGLSVTTQGVAQGGVFWQPKDTEDEVESALELNFGSVPQLLISGRVEIVDGRYIRNFNLIEDGLTPAGSGSTSEGTQTSTTSSEPFYEDIPLLAEARLDIDIDTRGFYVQNNLADIQMTGGVNIGGVIREPRISGSIQVLQGEFKIPGARAKFTRTDGTVAFDPNREIPKGSPLLNLSSESDYRDPSGTEHLVTLNITGSLGALDWDLYTSSGLNKGQTLTMLFSGRTPEELRKTLGEEAVGRDPSRIDPETDQSASLADQWLKDLTGDFISLLIEDKLRNLSSFDIARLEIGTDSLSVHLEKEWGKRLHTKVDLEQTSREQVLVGTGEVPVTNTISIEAKHIRKQSEDELQEDRSDSRLRVVRRFIWF